MNGSSVVPRDCPIPPRGLSQVDSQGGFDAIGIVVDWIDACKERHLSELLDLYEEAAIVECCEDGTFHGRFAVEGVLRNVLQRSVELAASSRRSRWAILTQLGHL